MNEMNLELQLRNITSEMEYPLTPNIAGSVAARLQESSRPRLRNRTLARSLVLAVILLASLMIIPPVRAAVLEFIQIGIVRIFRAEPAPAPQQIPSTMTPLTATPARTMPSLIPMLEEIAGETTLPDAQLVTEYPILLPTYPPDLGQPDRVFVQDADGPMTILVWMDAEQPDQVRMSLHFIPRGSWAIEKLAPVAVEETSVNGSRAVWAVGPYPIRLENGDMQVIRLVNGHVLIWEQGGITHRLESNLSMEEAIEAAESLEPIP